MKITLSSGLIKGLVFSSLVLGALAADGATPEDKKLATDDEKFWERFLNYHGYHHYDSMSMPPPPPPPPVDCRVFVDIDCTLADGRKCSQVQARTFDCIETFFYDIDIINTGTVDMDITVAEFIFNGQTFDLRGDLNRQTLAPGQQENLRPQVDVNVCEGGDFNARIRVEADPPNGSPCFDDDTYNVYVPPPPPPTPRPTPRPTPLPVCFVDVDLECRTESGQSCASLQPRNSDCIETLIYDIEMRNIGGVDMDITKVDFTFNGQTFDLLNQLPISFLRPGQETSVNPRIDINLCEAGTFDARVRVEADPPGGVPCFADDQYIFSIGVAPTPRPTPSPTRRPTPAPTPEPVVPCITRVELECQLSNGADCSTLESRSGGNCIETLFYDIDIINIGPVEMLVTKADFTFNGQVFDLVQNLSLNPVPAGQTVNLRPSIQVDVCGAAQFNAMMEVEANPPNGNMCQDIGMYLFFQVN